MKLSDLQKAYDYATLAPLFGVPQAVLKAHLYGPLGYTVFPIAKKSGGVRLIASPNKLRRKLQKRLLPVLEATYRASDFAHGFVPHRNVRSNAEPHVGKRTLLNVDLHEFFASITFKRVRGLFLKAPFSLQWSVANILAQICCFNGVVPAGGITSPVLSNLMMSRLDKRMASLVSRLSGEYTRYADDLSMSFDRPIGQLSSLVLVDNVGVLSVGGALSEIITSEGFFVNQEKLRVSHSGARKIVTGLVVNDKVNVKRRWYLSLESKMYAVEKLGWASVAKKEYPDETDNAVAVRMLMRRMHGKLSFLHMVRGKGDWLCADLAYRFNRLHSDARLRVSSVEIISRLERAPRGVFVVVGYPVPVASYSMTNDQGTGFCVESGLIVTAAHVVVDDKSKKVLPNVYVMNERNKKLEECDVLATDRHKDIAILKVKSGSIEPERHRFKISYDIAVGLNVRSVGYPDYSYGSHASVQHHQVVKKFVASLVNKAQINGVVQGGLSGGPLITSDMRVVGLIHRGTLAAGGIPELVESQEIKKLADSSGLSLT